MSSEDNDILLKWCEKLCGCKTEYWRSCDDEFTYKNRLKCKLHGGTRDVKLSKRNLPKLERKLNDTQRQIAYIMLLNEETQN